MNTPTKFMINGREVSRDEFWDSNEDGIHQGFYENGQLEHEALFLNGCHHGVHKYYDPNGQLFQEIPWQDGVKHGLGKRYHENGELASEMIWVHDAWRPDLLEKEHRLERLILFGTGIGD